MPINRYGQTAMDYWKKWLPSRYSLLEDPQTYFSSLGEQVEDLIESGSLDWFARDRAKLDSVDYLTRVGQLNAIRASVTEVVMADLVYLDPEPQTQEPELIDQAPVDQFGEWVNEEGMPVNPEHPLHAMLEDPNVGREQYRAALQEFWADLRKKVS